MTAGEASVRIVDMVHDPLARVGEAAMKAANARSALEKAVVAAQAAGHSLRDIAELAGMSHESVRQILKGREVKK